MYQLNYVMQLHGYALKQPASINEIYIAYLNQVNVGMIES